MSKLSFQYGFSVFLITPVVRVCSPLIVATAKGSGKPMFYQTPAHSYHTAHMTYGRHLSCIGHPPQ